MRGKPISAQLWSARTLAESEDLLLRALGPAGDPSAERLFRMQVTLCVHRVLTPREIEQLPAYFHTDPAVDLAGGPVQIIRETEPGWETTRPCWQPIRHSLDPRDPLLWLPIDCGDCPPCRARAALQQERERATGAAPAYLQQQLDQLSDVKRGS